MHQLLWISEIEIKSDGKYDNTGWSMNIGIENDSHFATHLHQTSSKSSMKSRLQILETMKIPCFLKTTELNIDAFRVPQAWCGPPTFNNGFSKRNRCWNWDVNKVNSRHSRPCQVVGTRFKDYEWTRFQCLPLYYLETLWFWGATTLSVFINRLEKGILQ